jgi:hypothetical protein
MFKKVETYTIKEFMEGKHREKKFDVPKLIGYSLPLLVVPSYRAFAKDDVITNTVVHALDPLIDLVRGLAYPIAGVMIAGGCLFILIGQKDKGLDMLKNAAIGYILVMLSPLFLKILVQIGAKAVSGM